MLNRCRIGKSVETVHILNRVLSACGKKVCHPGNHRSLHIFKADMANIFKRIRIGLSGYLVHQSRNEGVFLAIGDTSSPCLP